MKSSNVAYILGKYYSVSSILKIRNTMLQNQLSDPNISFDKAMSNFDSANRFCDKVLGEFQVVDEIIKSFSIEEQKLLYLYIRKNKTAISIAKDLGVSERTIFRKVAKVTQKFMKIYNQKEGVKNEKILWS